MTASILSRRGFLAGTMGLGTAAALAGCVGSSGGGGNESGGEGGGTLVFQNSIQDTDPKAALEKIVDAYDGAGSPVTMNSVATEQFRAQLTNYLRSDSPPDVLSWYAGSVANAYAEQGLLADVSELWEGDGACAGFPDALNALSTAADGTKIFVPTNYYWWSVFYRKSAFEDWGVEPPSTWDEFHALCETLAGKGVAPLANGIGSTPWMSSGWFDYLDLRINGAEFHRDLLAGEHAFNSSEVKDVMAEYARLIPYFDPNMASYSNQEAATPFLNGETGMYLVGAFVSTYMTDEQAEDLDFFSVPVINDSVPSAEEVPTDGYFAAAGSDNLEATMEFLSYLASPDAQTTFIEEAGSSNLPTSPDVDTSGFSPLVQKGIELLGSTEEVTQFFNRDSSDALQTTADTALTQFLDDPDSVDRILDEWQSAAEGVWEQ